MNILIVDDEPMQRDMLRGFLENRGYRVDTAADGDAAMERFLARPVQLVLLDYRMPGRNGAEVLADMKARDPLVRVIMITAHGDVDTAVTAMKQGADDFLEKPVDLTRLLERIEAVERRLAVEADVATVAETLAASPLPVNLIGSGPAMSDAVSLAARVAPTPWAVLIRGETGTGKELFARLVHQLSPRANGPFVEVNCGAVPENLFESELFGHEKGAFTGASALRRGRFELADGGTLFLDEVGELPSSLQPKLLRALQENRIQRVGGDRDIPVDVRVVTATHRELRRMVAEGGFREDLFYRLNVFDLELPPLRDRREDIPELTEFFLRRYATRPVEMDPDAMTMLVRYAFPGNVRELEHILQRTVTLARGRLVRPDDLPPEVRFHQASDRGGLSERLEAVERELILGALEASGWVQTKAGRTLGIGERVLRYKMKKYRIENPHLK